MQFMVIYMYAIEEKNMIIILCTLFIEKDTCIMVRITAVGVPGGEKGVLLPLLPFWGWREEWVKPGCAEVALWGDHWKVHGHEGLVLVQLSDCVNLFRCFQGFFGMFPGRVCKQVLG